MHTTELPTGRDTINIVLVETADLPASILITWPDRDNPGQFGADVSTSYELVDV